jgi:hypothetical protein
MPELAHGLQVGLSGSTWSIHQVRIGLGCGTVDLDSLEGYLTEDMPAADGEDLAAQPASLQGENERLQAQLEGASEPAPSGGAARSTISLILVVLGVVAVVAGVLAVWLQTTIADEDRYVDTFGPLPKNEAVAIVLSERLADELIIGTGLAEQVKQQLPPDLAFLAIPVTEQIHTLTAETAEGIIRSDGFSGIWQFALRASHASASAVLSTGGEVSLDLNEAAAEVVAALEERGVTLFSDLEIELPEILLFQSDQLEQAAGTLEVIDTLGWFLPLIALILIAGALWVSPNRRRTTAAIGFGTALGLLVTLVIVRVTRSGTVGDLDDETQRAAAEAIWDTTLRFYRQSMWALIIVALIIGFAAWVTGPSDRPERTRAWWNHTIAPWQDPDATTPTTGATGFITTWKRPLQWGTLTIGLLYLLFRPDASGWLVIITALVVLAIITIIEVVAGPEKSAAPAIDTES